ncbi:Putative cell wall binding repeat-containing protein [Bacillus sp. cl95]|nr:Putative cell wall binding repeat-containing protein [Bacillus sp. UNCCL13]SFQ88483.1 Putative cell wall binding repeat-containing protein [Bacillus sp. cl95]
MKKLIITSLVCSYMYFGGLFGLVKADASDFGEDVTDIALDYIGVPYQWGGTTPSGFDCSGFVGYVYKKAGVTLPRTAASIYSEGNAVSKSSLQKGDLVFFDTSSTTNGPSHIGVYIGDNQFVHASSSKGVRKDSLSSTYWNNTYYGVKRVGKGGWVYTAAGWNFLDANGAKETGWVLDAGKWYFLDSKGIMKTGWVYDGGKWYFLTKSGAMKTGWLYEKGNWYFLASSGAMKTGWLSYKNEWYYLYNSGVMAVNTTVDGYKIGSDGARIQ